MKRKPYHFFGEMADHDPKVIFELARKDARDIAEAAGEPYYEIENQFFETKINFVPDFDDPQNDE